MPHRTNIIIGLSMFFCVAFSFFALAQTQIINSGWQFSENKTQWKTINLPHTWNQTDAFDDEPGYRRGLGYYKKQIFISSEEKESQFYLKFNAVNQEATVFVNGQQVTNHKGGYTAFNTDITSFLNFNSYNLLEVQVDNSHNDNIPPLNADFTFYGGIYRDVELIKLHKQHFSLNDFASEGFYINYKEVSNEKAQVEVTSILDNKAIKDAQVTLQMDLLDADGNVVKNRKDTFKLPSDSSNEFKMTLPTIYQPKLWSTDEPYLYQLVLKLIDSEGEVLQTKEANVGFRWVSVDPEKGFFLNGKPIKLIGVNRHQDYKDYGNAVPMALQKQDIYLIKNMGGNVIRFAHYPHARELYKLCDELGILVWTEIPIVNKVTDTSEFFEVCTNMQKEHIKQYYNHPSVVMFGYMNEIFLRMVFDKNTEEERTALKSATLKLANQLEDLTRELAPDRLTVMACHLNEVYNETGIADLPMILGWNLYFGWYDAEIKDLGLFLDEQHKRYPNRSMLLSEYGPGADVRIFTTNPKKFDFSTDYQLKLHQSYVNQIQERPFMTGMTAWNFADFGSEFRGDAIPHVNQKGLVQYNRTPKDVYYWYQSMLNEKEPVLNIATDFLKDLMLFDDTYPVQIYSNSDQVHVSLNDQNLGDFKIENGSLVVEMPFKNGENTIKVSSEAMSEEKNIHVHKIETLDFKNFNRFGINVGAHFYFHDNEQKITFVPDQPYQKGLFGYVNGTAYGMTKDKNQGISHNIKNTQAEPLFQTMLEGCDRYQVDIPNGRYEVSLFFVEPQIKPAENIYNLSQTHEDAETKSQRVFDVYLNGQCVQKQLNLAVEYPEKYGVTITSIINVDNNDGLRIQLKPIEGEPVLSGILIEKIY